MGFFNAKKDDNSVLKKELEEQSSRLQDVTKRLQSVEANIIAVASEQAVLRNKVLRKLQVHYPRLEDADEEELAVNSTSNSYNTGQSIRKK